MVSLSSLVLIYVFDADFNISLPFKPVLPIVALLKNFLCSLNVNVFSTNTRLLFSFFFDTYLGLSTFL